MTLIHAAGLLVLFFVLLTLEMFIPSAGLLGVAAAACLFAAIVIGFLHSLTVGASILVGSAVIIPIVISTGLKVWPRTAIGRRMLTLDPDANAIQEAELQVERAAMIGKMGIVKTTMLPSGLVEIDGRRVDAISIGMAIERGHKVEVVSVAGGKIHVRPIEETPRRNDYPLIPTTLETPIESLGIDDI